MQGYKSKSINISLKLGGWYLSKICAISIQKDKSLILLRRSTSAQVFFSIIDVKMRHLNPDFQNQVWNGAIKWLVKYPHRLKLWTLNQSHFIRRLCDKKWRPGCSQNILCSISLLCLKVNFVNFNHDSILISLILRTIQVILRFDLVWSDVP